MRDKINGKMVKCWDMLLREDRQSPAFEIFKTHWTQSWEAWLQSYPCSQLEVKSASTGLFQPTLFYNSKSVLKWKISHWSDWRREEEAGMRMGTVQAVYVIEKHTEKCSKQRERKAFALIFNKHVMSFSFIRLKKNPTKQKTPKTTLSFFQNMKKPAWYTVLSYFLCQCWGVFLLFLIK